MRKFYIIISLILALITCDLSSAYATRPLYTEDCYLAPMGKPILEMGGLLLSNRDNTGIKEFFSTMIYSLSPNLETSLDLPYMSASSATGNFDGLADGSVKIKYRFYDDPLNAFCFQIGQAVELSTNSNPGNITPSANDTTPMFVYSGHAWDLLFSLNFGYTFDNEIAGTDPNDFIIYNASMTKEIYPDLLNVMGEFQYSRSTLTSNIVNEIALGLNYELNESVVLDTAIGCGLTEDSSSSNFVVGATVLFN